eukprot:g12395.t2
MFACCCEKADKDVVEVVGGVPLSMSEAQEDQQERKGEDQEGLSFTFELPNKTIKEVRFLSRPLGLDFSRSIPMHVKAVKQETSNERERRCPRSSKMLCTPSTMPCGSFRRRSNEHHPRPSQHYCEPHLVLSAWAGSLQEPRVVFSANATRKVLAVPGLQDGFLSLVVPRLDLKEGDVVEVATELGKTSLLDVAWTAGQILSKRGTEIELRPLDEQLKPFWFSGVLFRRFPWRYVALDVNDAVEVCTTRGWELAHVQSIQAANDSIAVAFEDGRSAVPKAEKTADSWKGSTGGRCFTRATPPWIWRCGRTLCFEKHGGIHQRGADLHVFGPAQDFRVRSRNADTWRLRCARPTGGSGLKRGTRERCAVHVEAQKERPAKVILLDHSIGIPEACILSVRCGSTRRQAPFETVAHHPLKFPIGLGELGEPLKVDVLLPLASARLVLHPREDLYNVAFEQNSDMFVGLKCSPHTGREEASQEGSKDAASSAKDHPVFKDYLERHGLLKYVQALLHAVIQVKPSDPYAYMIEQLSAAQSKRGTLAQIVSRPSSAMGVRPTPPSEPRGAAGRPRPPQKELVQVEQAPGPAAEEPLVLPGLEGVRLQLKGRLEEAFQSGSLEEAVRRAVGENETPEGVGGKKTSFAPEEPLNGEPDAGHLSSKLEMREETEETAARTSGRKGTGFVGAGDLPESDEDDEEAPAAGSHARGVSFSADSRSDSESKAAVKRGTGFVAVTDLPVSDDEEEEEEETQVPATSSGTSRVSISAVGHDTGTAKAIKKGTGFVAPADLPPSDDEDEEDEEMQVPPGTRGVSFSADARSDSERKSSAVVKKGTGFVAMTDLPVSDDEEEEEEQPQVEQQASPQLQEELRDREDPSATKQNLQSQSEGASETGRLENTLPVKELQPQEVEDIKEKMRHLLQDSVSTGVLEETLGKIKTRPGSVSSKPSPEVFGDLTVDATSYKGMILQKAGAWSLNGEAHKYAFDSSSGWLQVEGEQVGRFICERMQSSPLLFPESFSKLNSGNLPIISSEIMTEIHKEANHGALFVIPSQFNGAEYPYHTDLVFKDYKHDNSSGPRAQLAAHPAVAQFLLDNAANAKREGGINALDELLEKVSGFELVNGYLKIQRLKSGQEEALRNLQDPWHEWRCAYMFFYVFPVIPAEDHLHTLRPLIMEDILVQGLTPDQRGVAGGRHRVGLVYASAVPVDSYLNRDGDSEYQTKVAELLLVAQYYGALKHAATTAKDSGHGGRRKVFLMPLGTGVFHNSWEIIAKSMAKAVQMLDDDLLASLDICALARQGNPSEELKLQETFYKLNKYMPNEESVEATKRMLRSLLENAAEPGMGWIAHGPMDNFRIRPGFHVLLVAVQLQLSRPETTQVTCAHLRPRWNGGPPGPCEAFGPPWGAPCGPPFPDGPMPMHPMGPPDGGCRPMWFDGHGPHGPPGPPGPGGPGSLGPDLQGRPWDGPCHGPGPCGACGPGPCGCGPGPVGPMGCGYPDGPGPVYSHPGPGCGPRGPCHGPQGPPMHLGPDGSGWREGPFERGPPGPHFAAPCPGSVPVGPGFGPGRPLGPPLGPQMHPPWPDHPEFQGPPPGAFPRFGPDGQELGLLEPGGPPSMPPAGWDAEDTEGRD